jgi:hypothetical protein
MCGTAFHSTPRQKAIPETIAVKGFSDTLVQSLRTRGLVKKVNGTFSLTQKGAKELVLA